MITRAGRLPRPPANGSQTTAPEGNSLVIAGTACLGPLHTQG